MKSPKQNVDEFCHIRCMQGEKVQVNAVIGVEIA